MGKIVDGRYETDGSVEAILDRMVDNAATYFGESLKEDELNTIRMFYYPIAIEQYELQQNIGLVLDSAQIDHAEGQALDYLCALINVRRNPPEPAIGDVTMSRSTNASQDYTIPKGTVVQTDARDPVEFKTTESVTLSSGTSSVVAPIEAIEGGLDGNVATDRIVVYKDRPSGVESVTNNNPTEGGTPREEDDELRARAKEDLAVGANASARAILTKLRAISEKVRSVNLLINDTSADNANGWNLPDHSFEPIVECPADLEDEVAQVILDTKAVGDNCQGGVNGTKVTKTADLPGNQTRDISFSKPNGVKLYIDIEVDVIADEFPGKDAVRDSIVDYVGGFYSNGEPVNGELRPGDDVIYGEVEYAIREVSGVYDVTSLTVGTSDNPTGTSNLSVALSDSAEAEGNDSSIELITTEV